MPSTSVQSASTLCARGGRTPDALTGAVCAPVCQSTTFAQPSVDSHGGYTYSRADNPTVVALEDALGAIEESPRAVAFRTGMAAITAVFLAELRSGDEILCGDVVYGGTVRLLREILAPLGVRATFVDATDPVLVADAITDRTRLVLVESPGNPTLAVCDIAALAAACTRRGVLLAVDNTFLTAVGQRPLDLGADISIYSTTKYIDGHDATVGGAVVSRDETWLERLRFIRKTLGSIQAPWEAWLTLQGMKTLPLRLERQSETALAIARFLEGRPEVVAVHYPGLESHSGHDVAARQQAVFGGIVTFELSDGDTARAVMNALELCLRAENLGATETLVTHPASMTHADVPVEARIEAGITDGLVRLSAGLEDAADIIADLESALGAIR